MPLMEHPWHKHGALGGAFPASGVTQTETPAGLKIRCCSVQGINDLYFMHTHVGTRISCLHPTLLI